jgi:hypothetical protein
MALTPITVPGSIVEPAIRLTPQRTLRFAAAIAVFGAGMHYLVSGRKEASFNKMLAGAVLTLASLLLL